MARQLFEVKGRILGWREVPNFRNIPGFDIRPTESFAYFCPRCGEIWARLWCEGATYCQCSYRLCQAHGDGRLANGHDVVGDWPWRPAANWPKEALMRELLLEIKQSEFSTDAVASN